MVVRDGTSRTGLAAIFVEPSGENRITLFAGANAVISPDDLAPAFERSYDALLLNFETPESIARLLLRKADELHLPVSFC